MDKIKVIVVAGPTASGKSDVAIALARKFNGEIISADSRQVYRGMDIGTGKVTKAEQRMAPHWLLDVASPKRQYSAGKWRRAAQSAINDIPRRGKLPIICGGTGFWIDTLVYGLQLPEVKPDMALRQKLERQTTEQLFARLQKLDPTRAATIDRHNPRRLIRALEIVMATGKPVPPAVRNSPYDILYLSLNPNPSTLRLRIENRLDARLKQSMVQEVKRLHDGGVSWKRLESFGLEYRWLANYLQGKISKFEMRKALLGDIIAYSKRQLTWWRKNQDIVRITNAADAGRLVKNFLRSIPKTK